MKTHDSKTHDDCVFEGAAAERMRRMSVDEKIGQLLCPAPGGGPAEIADLAQRYHLGSVFVFGWNAARLGELTAALDQRTNLPVLIASDLEHGAGPAVGDGVEFPQQMALGAADDEALAEAMGRATAREGAAAGVQWTFSPVVDINYNPANPVVNVRFSPTMPGFNHFGHRVQPAMNPQRFRQYLPVLQAEPELPEETRFRSPIGMCGTEEICWSGGPPGRRRGRQCRCQPRKSSSLALRASELFLYCRSCTPSDNPPPDHPAGLLRSDTARSTPATPSA